MTDGTFVKEFRAAVTVPIMFGDRLIAPAGWEEKHKHPPSEPSPLNVSTLTGVRDYLAANIDRLAKDTMTLHVADQDTVNLVCRIEEEAQRFRRCTMLVADAVGTPGTSYGSFHDSESFIIWLMTSFVDTEDRARLIQLVGSIKDSASLTVSDDGMSQSIATQQGAVFTARETVNNPFVLAPFRTFREVPQPESPFILRMRRVEGDKPKLALFECDGGAWQLEAITRVATWLREQVKDVAVIA